MKVIIVSGTPGTGKTYLSKKLSVSLSYSYIDVKAFIEQKNLSEGFDTNMDCMVIDTKKLSDALVDHIEFFKKKGEKGIIIDSHLSHFLDPAYVDLCIITKCKLAILKERLEKRGYLERKVRENLDAEIFDTCRVEALESGYEPIVYWSDDGSSYDGLMHKIKGLFKP